MKKIACTLVVLLALIFMANGGLTPEYINYQGYVTEDGQPLDADSMHFEFRINNRQGTILWTNTATLAVSKGHYSTVIGGPGFTDVLAENQDLYMAVLLGEDSSSMVKTTAKRPLRSVPYAVHARYLAGGVDGLKVDGTLTVGQALDAISMNVSGTVHAAEIDLQQGVPGKVQVNNNLNTSDLSVQKLKGGTDMLDVHPKNIEGSPDGYLNIMGSRWKEIHPSELAQRNYYPQDPGMLVLCSELTASNKSLEYKMNDRNGDSTTFSFELQGYTRNYVHTFPAPGHDGDSTDQWSISCTKGHETIRHIYFVPFIK